MSEEVKKITEEELNSIVENNNKLHKLLQNIGIAESEKHALLHMLAGINQDISKNKSELEKKYGSININIEDGSYTVIEVEDKEKESTEEE